MSKSVGSFNKSVGLLTTTIIMLLIFKYTELGLPVKIPLVGIKIPDSAVATTIIAFLSIYFMYKTIIEWMRLDPEIKSKNTYNVEFYVLLMVWVIIISIEIYDYFKESHNFDTPVLGIIAILIISEFIASITHMLINSIKYIRSEDDALRLGLYRVPFPVRASLGFVPIIIVLIISLIIASNYWFSDNLKSIWVFVFMGPVVIHAFFILYRFVFPSKEEDKGMMEIFDWYDAGCQIDGRDEPKPNKNSVLFIACGIGDTEKVYSLLEQGYDPNEVNYLGWTPLLISVANNKEDIVNLLIDYGANINSANHAGNTALLFAAQYGLIKTVKKLIKAGAMVNVDNHFNPKSPLMVSVLGGHFDVVKTLLENGVDINALDVDGKNALHYAQKMGYGDIAKLLRNHDGLKSEA